MFRSRTVVFNLFQNDQQKSFCLKNIRASQSSKSTDDDDNKDDNGNKNSENNDNDDNDDGNGDDNKEVFAPLVPPAPISASSTLHYPELIFHFFSFRICLQHPFPLSFSLT